MRIKKQCKNCNRVATVVLTWQERVHDYQIPCPKCGKAQVAEEWQADAKVLIK